MCCLTTIFLMLGPRIAILLWWLAQPQRFSLAFKSWALPGNYAVPVWAWTLLGGILLPWTTLAYVYIVPGGIVGYEWLALGVAFVVDLVGHGGGYRHRNRIPSYRR